MIAQNTGGENTKMKPKQICRQKYVHYSIDHLHIPKAQEFQIYVIQVIKISLDITLILLLILGHTFT